MDERKWENLDVDCLANVFGRVGLESLLQNVPLVCKSWYKTSHNPLCWQNLVFPSYYDPFWDCLKGISRDDFVKFVIDRSHQSCTVLSISSRCSDEVLHYIANKCPALRSVSLIFCYLDMASKNIPELIRNWKQLESLVIGVPYNLVNLVAEISLHCKNFRSLDVSGWLDDKNKGYYSTFISDDDASAIVSFLPNIKCLILKGAEISEKSLVMILQGCQDLEHLDLSLCTGFEINAKILELASHISTFKYEGWRLKHESYNWFASRHEMFFDDDYLEDDFFSNLIEDLNG